MSKAIYPSFFEGVHKNNIYNYGKRKSVGKPVMLPLATKFKIAILSSLSRSHKVSFKSVIGRVDYTCYIYEVSFSIAININVFV